MPTYKFKNTDTNEEFEQFMSISELESFLKENSNITQLINGAPLIHSGRGMSKPDSGFRDVLKRIKDKHSQGVTKSSINTY